VPAQVTFANLPGDRVLGDSYGSTYQDGQLGVSCDFHDPSLGYTGDLTFHTTSNGPPVRPPRTMTFLFGSPFATGCIVSPGGSVPAASQTASLTVHAIYNLIPIGGT